MKTHALKPTQVDKVVHLFQEARLVMLLNGPRAPKVIRNDFGNNGLAEGRDAGDRGS